MPTIKDVARRAGVSVATVSATLNRNKHVSTPLQEKVWEAVSALGYAPNGIARSLKQGKTRLIGLIVADITNPFFAELTHVVESAARQAGYSIFLCNSGQDIGKELSDLRLLRTQRVEGVILAPTGQPDDYRSPDIAHPSLPLVFVDRAVPEVPVDCVVLDNHAAAEETTRYILGLGHRRIAMISGPGHLSPAAERLEGFKAALAAGGAPFDPSLVETGEFKVEDSYEACRRLLTRKDRPTALFVANNHMLIGVMRAIADLGMSCPRDISVAAVDDFPWADAFTPRLTTVRQPLQQIGETALGLLLKRIADGPGHRPEKVVLQPKLIIRDSCLRQPAGRRGKVTPPVPQPSPA